MQTGIFIEFYSGEHQLPQHVPSILPLIAQYRLCGLRGQLGAGKTSLVRAICQSTGANDVSSPSFSLINEYPCDGRYPGIDLLIHIDLYRLNTLEQALELGIEDYLYSKNIVMIEWPELIEPLWAKKKRMYIDILVVKELTRQYRISTLP